MELVYIPEKEQTSSTSVYTTGIPHWACLIWICFCFLKPVSNLHGPYPTHTVFCVVFDISHKSIKGHYLRLSHACLIVFIEKK